MLTHKFKIKNNIDVTDYCKRYTGMYHDLFFNFELSADKQYEKQVREKYNMDSWMYQSCKTEVLVKLKQIETSTQNKHDELEHLLSLSEFKNKRHKYKVFKKISYLKQNIGKSIIFGGKALLRKISYLSNPINNENTEEKELRLKSLFEFKSIWNKKRLMPISIIGESPQNSNRKFDFDLINKKVIYKPSFGIKIPIEFYCSNGQYKQLIKLQQQIGEQAISVKLDSDYIWITYDEQKLSGYGFNEKEYFAELKSIPKEKKQIRKDCFKKWCTEQEYRMLYGKVATRYIAFDLNPEYIGYCILQKTSNDGKFKILHKECISLEQLNSKLRLSSEDTKQVYKNNKRIFELNQVWKYIFKIAKHYKVANCVIEDLDFKNKGINTNSKEANRKTRNIWHRTKTTNLITKYCNTIGLKIIKINAAYSSFIGNIKHGIFDPVSSAIEIGRRGIIKYIAKNDFYPKFERSDFDTMYRLGLDVQNKTISTWIKAYHFFIESGLRYRQPLLKSECEEINLFSHKSCTIKYKFI